MNIFQAKQIAISVIADLLGSKLDITQDSKLIGEDSLLDSINIVEVSLAL